MVRKDSPEQRVEKLKNAMPFSSTGPRPESFTAL
jgi:hypothetical protein